MIVDAVRSVSEMADRQVTARRLTICVVPMQGRGLSQLDPDRCKMRISRKNDRTSLDSHHRCDGPKSHTMSQASHTSRLRQARAQKNLAVT